MTRGLALLPPLLLGLFGAGCAVPSEEAVGADEEAIEKTGESPPWLYEGPMPVLESPSLTVSIAGHTTRITGLLPTDYDASKLPWYALALPAANGRTSVTVVWPAASGRKIDGKWNNVPGTYDHLNVRPYRPRDPGSMHKEHWGGFPFLNYHDDRRFALHGPIDFTEDMDVDGDATKDTDWRLVRGRISAGCQRMQGEHVLELTHMLGFDMRAPHSTRENKPDPKNGVEGKYFEIRIEVLAEPKLDTIEDETGAEVALDVAYPKHESVPPIPASTKVRVMPTWDANEMMSWACAVKDADNPNIHSSIPRTGGRFDGSYCARTRGANKRDARTGLPL